ncbi:MAG: hypothetical protein Hyperionvirus17_18 [Hyperionvirus sp.]|uniref:Uncharacterized protein n=1 Tax=Hyperionvirus sp. TaxID=2487770 RepID=A0A3G5AA21_9VIRU|nr:MAG: hypothetical protein Hyperionvirus17_18 [Hyperionvirus sp.]
MNIVEAYIKYSSQLVILISGVSGTGISHLAKSLAKDTKLPALSYAKYCKPNYDKKVTLPDDTEVINWDTDEIIEWDRFNRDIKEHKNTGVIAFAPAFPLNRLDPDLVVAAHLHIKLSKDNLYARRKKYIEAHVEECGPLPANDQLIFNRLTYPYYKQSQENSVITKYLNANEFSNDPEDVYDQKLAEEAFKYLMLTIQKWLDSNQSTILKTTKGIGRSKKASTSKCDDDSPISDSDEEDDELEDEGYSILYK